MAIAVVVGVALLAGCGDSGRETSGRKAKRTSGFAVGTTSETFVDRSRSTPARGDNAKKSERTLKTAIFYPATGSASANGASADATPDRDNGPYPLVVFGHGLGATPGIYEDVLVPWAEAGYVIAAPYFPISNSEAPGGADGSDLAEQPGDMSFVITQVLAASARATGTLAGMIDAKAIGAAGHSNGALTTLGLVANTCCHDDRVKAAVVLAGNPILFQGGTDDFADAPPLLFVHGQDDPVLPYDEAVGVFDKAVGPKGLLTVLNGSHGDWVAPSSDAHATVVKTTVDFLDAYLRGDDAARDRIAADGKSDVTSIQFVTETGSKTTS